MNSHTTLEYTLYSIVVISIVFTVWCVVFRGYKKAIASSVPTAQGTLREIFYNTPPLLKLSGQELSTLIKAQEISSEGLVRLAINHIQKVNPYINAICKDRFTSAIREAQSVDRMVATGKVQGYRRKVFFGVPFIAKECFEIPGMPYTAGIPKRKGIVGTKLCPAMRRLVEEGGGIIIASGNLSEACMWYESNNPIYGRSKNPYDLTRGVGGSSGGNAALVAAMCAPLAITSDVGGSTRIPALFNGLFGHKPTGGTVPNWRTHPVVEGQIERYCQLGPCCRHSSDLFPLLTIIAGVIEHEDEEITEEITGANSYIYPLTCPSPDKVNMSKVKVLVSWDQPGSNWPFVSRRSREMVEAQDKAIVALEQLGCKVELIEFKEMKLAFDIWSQLLESCRDSPFYDVLCDGPSTSSALWELFKYIISFGTLSEHTLPAIGLAAIEKILDVVLPQSVIDEMIGKGEDLLHKMKRALQGDTILLMPSLPVPAPKHGPLPLLLRFADAGATGILNVLEFPATAVPMGLNKQGLPTGIQVVADHGNDHLTIATAIALETAGVAGWSCPSLR